MELPPAPLLPCPLNAGWQIVEQRVLDPYQGGGFSAGAYRPEVDELWLLSDAPRGSIGRWRGLEAMGLNGLQPLPPLLLKQPEPMDGEGLVLEANTVWVAAEGRREQSQPAALLRYDLSSGWLERQQPLPPAWRIDHGRGLVNNGGPESLTRLPSGSALLMAAEKPLLQDPPDRVRLLRWDQDVNGQLQPRPLRPLALPPGGWGLTDLLATEQGLLALWRRFTAPDRWQARLVLYPAAAMGTDADPDPAGPPVQPRMSWNLLQLGLPADNWEVLLAAPPLADGRASLILASDDNFNPLQRTHLIRLAAQQQPGCIAPPQP